MADILFVAITVAFFALCVLYVNWCDRIIGADEFGSSSTASPTPGATATERSAEEHKELAA